MTINFSNALGIHEQALQLREHRAQVLAANIANADTPGYKARDIDFREVLLDASDRRSLSLGTRHPGHIGVNTNGRVAELSYRVPQQAAVDGNTVDEQQENAAFARNALEHQASFVFLNGKFAGLMKALRGE